MFQKKRWRFFLLGAMVVSLFALALVDCGGSAAPTSSGSDGTTPVAVELPAISTPTSIATSVSDVTQYASQSVSVTKATDPTFLRSTVTSGPTLYAAVAELVDRSLARLEGMSCAAGSGVTTCSFTGSGGYQIKVDFSPFSFSDFSDNRTNQTCSLDCVADTGTALSGNAICMRVWLGGIRYLIGKFTVRPTAASGSTAAEKGAGCFRVTDFDDNVVHGAIYDKSATTAASSTGPNSYLHVFVNVSDGNHINSFATETGTNSSTQLLNFGITGTNPTNGTLQYIARWTRNESLWYGKAKVVGGGSYTDTCATKAGVETTGCGTNLTSPALPDYLNSSVDADTNFPSTSVFPTSPTF